MPSNPNIFTISAPRLSSLSASPALLFSESATTDIVKTVNDLIGFTSNLISSTSTFTGNKIFTSPTIFSSTISVAANANFDGGTLFVDAVNNRVGIGNSTPAQAFRVEGITSLNGAVNALSTFGISGAVNALSTLGVSGAVNALSTFGISGAVNALSTLGVSGAVNALSTLGVSGVSTFNGQVNIATTTKLAFGAQVRQMIDLWNTNYGIGVQSGTQYYRADSRFSWFIGGAHSDSENTPGTGGTTILTGNTTGLYITSSAHLALHAGNYNSYAPTLTGSGASGSSWNISILGNAATVTNGMYLSGNQDISGIKAFYTPNGQTYNLAAGNIGLTVYNNTTGADAMMTFHVANDWAGYFGLGGAENDLVWTGWSVGNNRYRILHTGNYNSYVPTLTGTGASGNWNINAVNITAYTINQSVGTGNTPTFVNAVLRGTSPTLYLRDTDHRSSMIHCNSNLWYVLRGSGTDSDTWAQYNGEWPLYLNLENNDARFGGAVVAAGTKSFRIRHPHPELNETHDLLHFATESPRADLIYRGRAELINGIAKISIDAASHMRQGTLVLLAKDFDVFAQMTTSWTLVRGYVDAEGYLNLEAQTPVNGTVTWLVIGQRQDLGVQANLDSEGNYVTEVLQFHPDPGILGIQE